MALHLDGNRGLVVEAGPKHPSGDGGRFLPFANGTVEFFVKPFWSFFDLFPVGYRHFLTFENKGKPWFLRYGVYTERGEWPGAEWRSHSFDAQVWGKTSRNVCLRKAIVEKGEWLHVAFVWGQEKWTSARKGPLSGLSVRVYVNGKRGRQWANRRMNDAVRHAPARLEIGRNMPGLVDGLRISGVRRYAHDFEPPASEEDLEFDAHTRLLLRFNGNLDGKSHGWDAPLPGGSVTLRTD